MTDRAETEIRLAETLRSQTNRLDNETSAALLTSIAACSMQLAQRCGFAVIARDLRELAEVHEKAARRGAH